MKKILLIVGTHGDERIGIETVSALRLLGLEKYFDVLVANPLALIKNARFIQKDLNRSYPGDMRSSIYETKLAAYNLAIAKKYRFVIDLHEASAGTDDFIIVPRKSTGNKFPLQYLNLTRVLLWPDPIGPLGGVLSQAVELEFGMKNRSRILAMECAVLIVKYFINCVYRKGTVVDQKQIYYVYGKLDKKNFRGDCRSWRDFRAVTYRNETFLPLLVGQYPGVVCYKMKKVK